MIAGITTAEVLVSAQHLLDEKPIYSGQYDHTRQHLRFEILNVAEQA